MVRSNTKAALAFRTFSSVYFSGPAGMVAAVLITHTQLPILNVWTLRSASVQTKVHPLSLVAVRG